MTLTTDERKQGLGGTDVAGIVGVSPYRAPIDVYQEKIGEKPGQEMNALMAWGLRLEDAVADGYSEQTGRVLQRMLKTVRHKTYPFLYVHPDRLIVNEPGLVEIKTQVWARGYGETETDDVPPHVAVQCQWQMALTGRLFVDVVLFTNISGLRIYTVQRDDDLINGLVTVAVDFWQENVQRKVPPPIDGTEATRRYLSERFPKDDGLELVATPEQALLVDELRLVKTEAKALESRELLVANRIKEAMGEHTALVSDAGRVTWKRAKDSVSVSWQHIAAAYRQLLLNETEPPAHLTGPEYLDTIEGLYTLTEPGSRRFLATFKAQEEQKAA